MSATQDSVNVGMLATVSIAGLLFTYASVLALQALYLKGVQNEQATKVLAVPQEAKHQMLEAGQARLSGYGWVDRDAGVVHIPLAEAERRLLEASR